MTDGLTALTPGDVVCIRTSRLPSVQEFRAAVESVKGDEFSVFSMDLADHCLTPEDLTFRVGAGDYQILKHTAAEVAVPQESYGWHAGDRLRATIADGEGRFFEGKLIAAIDGLAYCKTDKGEDFSAEVSYLKKVDPAA